MSYATAPATLVLSLRTTCPFCTDSMPFYRRLVEQREALGRSFRVAAVSPEDSSDFARYLGEGQLAVDIVAKIDPKQWLEYLRTPTAFVVDAKGRIRGSWTGALSELREAEVETVLGLRRSPWWKLVS